MDSSILVSVVTIESAWIRLSENPEYQQVVKYFFRARSFYKGAIGLFTGTRKGDGRRAVYCNAACVERLSKELAERVRTWLQTPTPPQCPPADVVEDVQPLNLQSEEDVKRFLKDLKRAARFQKQSNQLAAAQTQLLQVRCWTAPFTPPPPTDCAAAAITNRTNLSDHVEWPPLPGAAVCRSHPLPASVRLERLASDGDDGTSSRSRTPSATADNNSSCQDDTNGGWGPAVGRIQIQIQANAGTGPSAPEGLQGQQGPATANRTDDGASLLATAVNHLTVKVACATVTCTNTNAATHTPSVATASDGRPSQAPSCTATPSWMPAGRAGSGGGAGDDADAGQLVVFCCVDLEWWERDNAHVTEVGWTLWDNLTRRLKSRHYIVSENEAYVNGTYVPNHKYEFQFGSSVTRPLADAAAALQHDLEFYGDSAWTYWWGQQAESPAEEAAGGAATPAVAAGDTAAAGGSAARQAQQAACGASTEPPPAPRAQLVVVGHGLSGDLKALSSLLGVTIPSEAAIVDTADLAWAALGSGDGRGNGERKAMSLRVLLKTLGIQASKLHNGGNDARYTMEAMLALAALDPSSYVV